MKNVTFTPSRLLIFALILALTLTLTSCASFKAGFSAALKGDIQQGTWSDDGKVFTNEWSNIKFTMPGDGYVSAPKEQIDELMEAGAELVGQTGVAADITMMRIVYDFMVSDGSTNIPNITLIYENVGSNAALKNVDEAGYFDIMLTQFEQMESQGLSYTELNRSTASIADIEWVSASYSLNDIAKQDYYLHLSDGYMCQLIVTYNDSTAQAATDLLAGFSAAK